YVYSHPFLISPHSKWVVYRADQDADEDYELYRAPLSGGSPPVRLTDNASSVRLIAISADDRFAVFAQSVAGATSLCSVSLQGGPARLLSGALAVALYAYAIDVTFDGAGHWVLFRADTQPGMRELFAAPIAGGAPPVHVNGAFANGAGGATGDFLPRSSAVLY